jgi:putative transposase
VDEYGFVLDILLQRHRDTEAAKTFLTRLLGEYDVPEVIHTDQLRSYGAAIREIPSLVNVDHQHVISTSRCNNVIEREHRSTRRQERQQQGFKQKKRAQEFLSLHAWITNLHHHSRTSAAARRSDPNQAFQTWSTVAATLPFRRRLDRSASAGGKQRATFDVTR